MGSRKLLLLVLFASSCTFAQEDAADAQSSTCLRDATKFKHLRKYVYNYEAQTSTGVTGTADTQSGSKFSCKVELEVPQLCNFILRIKECTLREVYGVNPEGKALFKKSKNSEDFSSAMSKYEVNFSVLNGKNVVLYPQKDEALNILNMKRGIISALVIPDETQENSYMDTVYGKCSSQVTVNTRNGATATDVTVDRNLKTCDQFVPIRDYVSPLALIKGLNSPLSTLIRSSQSCQYSMDPKRRHITDAICTEKHLFLPFSHKNEYGIMAKVVQTLKLEDVAKTNSREFDGDSSLERGLALEAAIDKNSKNVDTILENLEELQKLSTSERNQQRAGRFHKLVTGLRSLNNETLGPLIPKLTQLSSPITLQALAQCGTPECFGGILQVLRSGEISPVLSDAVTYGLGLLPSPCTKRVRELLNMAQYQPGRASFYALSHAVNNFFEDTQTITPDLKDVADFMVSLIGNDCTQNEDKTFLSLKAIGIMGKALEAANPEIKPSLLKCVKSPTPSLEVQKAAIQAFRRMTITDEVRSALVQTFLDSSAPMQKRLAAYLIVMKNPSQSDLRKVTRNLVKEQNEQVKNFVASHIINILNSDAPEVQELRAKLEESLKGVELPSIDTDMTKFSQNYQFSKSVAVPGIDETFATKAEGNFIFDSSSYLPKEAMLEATLNVFGKSVDMFEVGLEVNGFEPTLEALFGKGGFFPDCTMKALYWVDGKVPDKITEILYKWFGISKQDKQNQDITKAIILNAEKLIKELRSSDAPEAKAYLEILGKELGYLKLSDVKTLGNMLMKSLHTTQELPGKIIKAISKGFESDLFLHYIFMDNEFDLPTGSGLQLQVSLSGIVAPGTKAGMRVASKNIQAELSMKPAITVEFVTKLGIHIPEFSRHAVQMNTNIYHESGFEARISVKQGQFKFSIPAPSEPTKLLSINNELSLIFPSKTEVMPSIMENREERSSCRPLFTGLVSCTNIGYSNAGSIEGAPRFPLTGQSRFEVEIRPTGEVQEYSVTASYNLVKEEDDLIDTLKFSAQAEGTKTCEASLTTKYNRNKIILTSDVKIPGFDIDFGLSMKVKDESMDSKKSYDVVVDFNNQQVSELTLTGKIRSDPKSEFSLGTVLSIPRLHTEAVTDVSVQYLLRAFKMQLQSSATICALSGSQSAVFTYDNEKVELEWSTTANSNLKKIISKLPDVSFSEFADYPESLKNYANDVLDHKVAQTDMTLRHIVSQSLVASNNWVQKASKDMPYANTLHKKLIALKELNFQEMGLPPFPEQLYLNSDGRVSYLFNKDSIIINVPLPYGGKSSEQLRVPRTVKSPSVNLQAMGLSIPSQEFNVPSFTIPEYYQLKVPLIGVLELSSNVKSNYYNWSASYTGGNTTIDAYTFITKYEMKAESILDVLSYKIDGNALTTYEPEKSLSLSYEASLYHSLLETSVRLRETYNFNSNQILKETYALNAKSILGLESSVASTCSLSKNDKFIVLECNINGRSNLASMFANFDYTAISNLNHDFSQEWAEFNFNLDSSILQATNKLSIVENTITSTTNVQNGALTNTWTLDYGNGQNTFKSVTNGDFYNLVVLNKYEITLSKQKAAIRSEYQADYKRHRFYTLLSGSLDSLGLELNADVNLNNQANRAAHKGTLTINQDGLSTSATTNVNYNPLTLENEFNAAIGSMGAAMKMTANGRYRENNARFTIDSKAALSELSFGSVYQFNLFDIDSKNVLYFKVSKEGLKFSNNWMGSFEQIKLENNNELSIVSSVIMFTSKFKNTLDSDKSYNQNFELQIQPYILTALLNNEFQYGPLELTNKGQLQLEPLKMNLDGNMKGAFNKDEIKHSYTISYGDLTANLKSDTVASIQGTAHSHRMNMEIAGLSASFRSNTNCESKSMRLSNVFRSVIAPFTLTIDSHTTGDGRLMFLGEHTGQLYNKIILKAEPLAFNLDHDYRGSTGHSFGAGNTHNTLVDYKVNILFTPSEQKSLLKLKSQLNQNIYTQEFNAYNNPVSIGIELSGQTLADLSMLDRQINLPFVKFNPIDALNLRESVGSPQEFGISGYVRYDKNEDMHIINLPFIESLPLYFEKVRSSLLTSLQALQTSLKDINIDQYVSKYRRSLDKLPQRMNDYMNSLELERNINEAKEKVASIAKRFRISAEELQIEIEKYFREALINLQNYVDKLENAIRENYNLEKLKKVIEVFIHKCLEQVKYLDEQYKFRVKTVQMIQDLKNFVEGFNLNDVEKSLAAWIKNVDDTYQIKAKLRNVLEKLQSLIERFDIGQIAETMKAQLDKIDINEYTEYLKNLMPVQKINFIIEQIQNIIVTLLQEYDVNEKINVIVDKFQVFVAEYGINRKIQRLIEDFIQLLNQQKVKETIQTIADMLNDVDIKMHFNKILKLVENAIKQVRDYDYKTLVDDINNYLDIAIKKMKSFNYEQFVNEINDGLREVTTTINNRMRELELPQKAEALKQYLQNVRKVFEDYFIQLRDTKFSSVVQWYQDLMSSTVLNDFKSRTKEMLEDARDRIYSMDIKKECQRYLQQASQLYNRIITCFIEQWNIAAEKMTNFAVENNIKEWAEKVKLFVEEGFVVPEIKLVFITVPSFEFSLRAFRQATFKTVAFIVPFTDLYVESVEFNFRRLREINIPTRFVTPEFTILNTYKVPSYTIDLNEIKLQIVRTIDQILSSDFELPSPKVYFKDLTMSDMVIPTFSFPEVYIPNMQIPELQIPTLNLKDYQFADIRIPDFQLPKIPHTVAIPTFGKFSSSFKVNSPFFTMKTLAEVQNTTISESNPEFYASLSAETTSQIEALVFTLVADARASAPLLEQLILKESVVASSKYAKFDHNTEMTFTGENIQIKAETIATLHTDKNSAEFHNDIIIKLQKKITADINTKYSHKLNIPQFDISSQIELQNEIDSLVEAGRILFTSTSKGNWKWSCPAFSDEGIHQGNLKFTLRGGSIDLSGSNKVTDKYFKMDQSIKYNSVLLNNANIEIMSKVESPYVGNSIASVKGSAQISDMKAELTATHNAELTGKTTGKISNDFSFLTKLFEIKVSTNNNGNLKVSFPLKLTGKIEFLNNYNFILSSDVQQISWQANGRFNQYKVSHIISAGNSNENIEVVLGLNGEANLDFLTIPITIPEILIPYSSMKIPEVREFSLWDKTGLNKLLTSTKQNFDLNVKLQYAKNKDMHSIPLPLGTIYDSINSNMKTLNIKFEKGRDKALNVLQDSYNQAKVQLDKYKLGNTDRKVQRTIRIPGYTIPLMNIEVSPFTAELPSFGYILPKEISTPSFMVPLLGFSIPTYTLVLPSLELPVLHIPNTLRKLTLPKFKLPTDQNSILIPAIGNLTYDFSFKSNVISITTSAGLYNQSDISARVSVISTSVIDVLQFNIDATTGLTRKRGLKLATALAMKTVFIEGKHESSLSFGRKNMEASVITNGKLNLALFKMTLKQELTGNTKTKPTISSKMNIGYDFNDSVFGNSAKGTLDHTLSLESLSSYFSLEMLTNGDITGTIFTHQDFSGKFTNEANTYLNSNGARSSVKLVGMSKVDGFSTLDLNENLAIEASTRRIYAVWEHQGENYLRVTPLFTTKGNQNCRATLELSLWSLLTDLQLQINQPNSYFEDTSFSEGIVLSLNTEKQEFSLNAQGTLYSLIIAHGVQLSNDKTDARFEIDGSLQGHADFLKAIILPVYEKSVWDVLKFDLETSDDQKQYLNVSTSVIYTKNKDGLFFPLPLNMLEDGFIIKFPALTLKSPEWINKVRNYDMPEIPTVLEIPSFKVPFTSLDSPAYKIDFNNIKIHEKISTLPFDVSFPSLPKVKFPKVDISTQYITLEEYKIPYFEVTIPQYQITLARYTFPKSFYNIDFNKLANKVADIDIPTIEIPEQYIEIPPVKLNLPAGIFIPAFGALTGSMQLTSPIYNLTWTSKLANNSDNFAASIDATCSSTLQFLQYDLEASTTSSIQETGLYLNGKGTFSHKDFSVDWKQDVSFDGLRIPRHNVEVNVESPTFTNVQIRCQNDKNKMSSSVTSPSAGTLGLILEKDSTTFKGKLFSRTLTSPGKENVILKTEISLKNPGKIQNKINWKEDAAQDILKGFKERLPKMSDAVYNCINKYHKEHLGMELSDASLKMKDSLQYIIVSPFRFTENHILYMEHQLRIAARGASNRYMDIINDAPLWYKVASDCKSDCELTAKMYDESIAAIRLYKNIVKDFIDATIIFLKNTKFQLPGQPKRYNGEELYNMAMENAMGTVDQLIKQMLQLFDIIVQSIYDVKLWVPGSNRTINGKEIVYRIKNILNELQQIAKQAFTALQNIDLEVKLMELKHFTQEISQRFETIIETLKSRNYQDLRAQVQQMYSDAVNSEYGSKLNTFADETNKFAVQLLQHIHPWYVELLEKLKELHIYAKALREEYLDPNIVGWSVKYYEIEEKVLELVKFIFDSLKELSSKYGIDISQVSDNIKDTAGKYYVFANELATNVGDRGREHINEISLQMERKIAYWSESTRKLSEEQAQNLRLRVQEIYNHFVNSYRKFINETNRLIDVTIETYNSFIEFITNLLQSFQNSASEEMKTYISTRKGEIKVDVPHPFDWKSFDEIPHLRSDIISKRMEIIRSMVLDGTDKSSKKWEELQSFIDKQLEEGKLSAQQIIDNIQKWEKN